MESERWIVRLFLVGGASAHAGAFEDYDRACRRADAIARRCRRRGVNASATVRPLLSGGAAIDDLIDAATERGSHHASSYAGVSERRGDSTDARAVADAILDRGDGRVALLPGEVSR